MPPVFFRGGFDPSIRRSGKSDDECVLTSVGYIPGFEFLEKPFVVRMDKSDRDRSGAAERESGIVAE